MEINVVIGMQCERCKNTDPKYFAYDHGIYYCRKCIAFGRLDVGEKPKVSQVSHVVYKKGLRFRAAKLFWKSVSA